jgi:ribosomal protein S25
MKAITPYTLATKYNIKLSAAKMVLKTLEQKGLIQLVAANKNLKVYQPGNIA